MCPSREREPLASVDRAWLHMDDAANLMVVTLVLMFERPLAYETIRRLIETRLLKLPRFRQRVVEGAPSTFESPLHRGACWEEDPHFDVDHHLEPAALDDPDDESALHRLVSGAMSRPFDPSRPLWHFYFVPRYGQGSALVARIHHCIGDGLGLIYVFLSMADEREWHGATLGCGPPAPRRSSQVAMLGRTVAGCTIAASRLLLMRRDRTTRLKGPLAVEKRASWSTPVPLDDVKAVSRKLGASINDVLLTAVSGAVGRYLSSHGRIDEDLVVRGVVPVNLRRPEDAHLLGNRFGLVFLSLPVGLADPRRRLAHIGEGMRALKRSQEPLVTFQILRALGIAPRPIFDFVVRVFGRKATAVVTNVIGPRQALTFAGVRLAQVMFWVPCAGKLGLGISILSYAGRVSVGFATDASLIPDPETIVKAFDAELAGLLGRRQEQPAYACLVG